MNCLLRHRYMGILRAEWRVHISAIDEHDLVEQSLEWLCGIEGTVDWSKQKSFHGPSLETGIVKIERRKLAVDSLRRLGSTIHQKLLDDGLEKRLDEHKNLHVRISLSKLVRGELELSDDRVRETVVKGTFKIEAYPGQNHLDIATELIRSMT